jgi:hypothetical protein
MSTSFFQVTCCDTSTIPRTGISISDEDSNEIAHNVIMWIQIIVDVRMTTVGQVDWSSPSEEQSTGENEM